MATSKRMALTAKLGNRDTTLTKGGQLLNIYSENTPKGNRVAKRPGLRFRCNLCPGGVGQGLAFFIDKFIIVSCDTLFYDNCTSSITIPVTMSAKVSTSKPSGAGGAGGAGASIEAKFIKFVGGGGGLVPTLNALIGWQSSNADFTTDQGEVINMNTTLDQSVLNITDDTKVVVSCASGSTTYCIQYMNNVTFRTQVAVVDKEFGLVSSVFSGHSGSFSFSAVHYSNGFYYIVDYSRPRIYKIDESGDIVTSIVPDANIFGFGVGVASVWALVNTGAPDTGPVQAIQYTNNLVLATSFITADSGTVNFGNIEVTASVTQVLIMDFGSNLNTYDFTGGIIATAPIPSNLLALNPFGGTDTIRSPCWNGDGWTMINSGGKAALISTDLLTVSEFVLDQSQGSDINFLNVYQSLDTNYFP